MLPGDTTLLKKEREMSLSNDVNGSIFSEGKLLEIAKTNKDKLTDSSDLDKPIAKIVFKSKEPKINERQEGISFGSEGADKFLSDAKEYEDKEKHLKNLARIDMNQNNTDSAQFNAKYAEEARLKKEEALQKAKDALK